MQQYIMIVGSRAETLYRISRADTRNTTHSEAQHHTWKWKLRYRPHQVAIFVLAWYCYFLHPWRRINYGVSFFVRVPFYFPDKTWSVFLRLFLTRRPCWVKKSAGSTFVEFSAGSHHQCVCQLSVGFSPLVMSTESQKAHHHGKMTLDGTTTS